MRRRGLVVVAAVALLLGSIAVVGLSRGLAENAGATGKESLRTVLEVISLVRGNYVEEVSLSSLLSAYAKKGTISGMLASAVKDPYSRYLNQAAYAEMKIDNSGEFGGIGVYLGMSKDNELLVIAPIEETPADKAGMKAGDHIVLIDGRSTVNMSTDEAASKMRGPKGTAVVVTVERGADKVRKQFRLVRDVIKVPSVKGKMLTKEVGYLRIASFTATTADDLERNLTKLEGEGMKGLVLDLRFNPGGLLNAAVDVLSRFLDQGPLLHVVGRGAAKQTFFARPGLVHPDYPVVVLVNGGSASAAEIVAGALQDTHRAIVLGTKTFGKGSVQTIYPLADGSALSLTTQKWLTAGGHSISQKGIMPDVVVKNPGDDEMEAELQKLREERQQSGSLDPQAGKKPSDKPAQTTTKPAEEKTPGPAAEEDTRDYQLEKAQEIILQQLQGRSAGKNAA